MNVDKNERKIGIEIWKSLLFLNIVKKSLEQRFIGFLYLQAVPVRIGMEKLDMEAVVFARKRDPENFLKPE